MNADHEPPVFPPVGDATSGPGQASVPGSNAHLFTSPAQRAAEADSAPIAIQPVADNGPRRGSRLRWLVAGAATLLVVVVMGAVLVLAVPRAGGAPATASYVPANTAMYADVRLDLPGDQHDNLATLMSHFPGFADRAAFEQKMDETLDSIIPAKSDVSWQDDIKPWFGGQMAAFGTPPTAPPAAAPDRLDEATYADANVALVLTVKDQGLLNSTIDAKLNGMAVDSIDYQGTQIRTVEHGTDGERVSFAVTEDALVVSPTIELVQSALDVHAGRADALANDQFFLAQTALLPADRLATFYGDAAQATASMAQPSVMSLPAQCSDIMSKRMPMRTVGALRAESNKLAFTTRTQLASGTTDPNRHTTLAEAMPADTAIYLELRDVGARAGDFIDQALKCAASTPNGPLSNGMGSRGDPSKLFEQLLGTQPADFLDFVDDAALGVSMNGKLPSAGMVATVNDEAVASQRVGKIFGLFNVLNAFGGSPDLSMTTEQSEHNGTTVYVIHLPVLDGPPMSVAMAVANGRLYVGVNDFVTGALDRTAVNSLASSATFTQAFVGLPEDNAFMVYLDVPTAVAAAQANGADPDLQPLLAPLTTFSAAGHDDGGILVTDGFLLVE